MIHVRYEAGILRIGHEQIDLRHVPEEERIVVATLAGLNHAARPGPFSESVRPPAYYLDGSELENSRHYKTGKLR